jgi:TP901 family phage tail tape measure protein
MNIGDVFLRLRADDAGFDKEVQRAGNRAATKGGEAFGQQFGKNMLGELTRVAIGAVGVRTAFDATIGAAIEWESQFAGVEKTVDATAEEMAVLEHELRTMSKTMPVARGELALIAEQAGALGIASDDIAEFTEVVAQIGATTNVSSEQAATSLGQLSNVLGLTQKDYERFASTLVDLGNKGASTEQQILEIASRAGAGANLIGIAADETLGWSSAVANLGIEAEAGGSTLQTFFLQMTKNVEVEDRLKIIARTAGTTAAEFKKAFQEDASGALQLFIAGLGELDQASQLDILSNLKMKDIRISRTLLGLAGNVDNLTDSLEIGAEAWVENTALAEEYGKRAQTTASRIEMLTNRIGDLGVRLGEAQGGPVNLVLSAAEASVAGWENIFLDMELRFGEHSERLNALAEDMGIGLAESFMGGGVIERVKQNAKEWGTSVEETIRLMEQGITPALLQQEEAWQSYQEQIAGAAPATSTTMAEIDAALEPLSDEVVKEMEEAREAAVEGMAGVLKGMTDTLAEDPDSIKNALDELLTRAGDAYTDFQRRTDVEAELAATGWKTILASQDTGLIADAVERAESLIDQYELVEPGALAAGKLVNPAMQTGMDENIDALITWIETNVTGEAITALTLEEAEELGIDGIWAYAKGMASQEEEAKRQAGIVASRAANELSSEDVKNSARDGGRAVADAWINGITSRLAAQNPEVVTAVNYIARNLGGSLPEDGPLKGDTAEKGGQSVGDAWVKGLTGALGGGLGSVGTALSPAVPLGAMAGAAGNVIHVHWSSIKAPNGPAELRELGMAIGDAVESELIRRGRFDRRTRN